MTASARGSPPTRRPTIIASQNADWLREKAIPVSQAMFQANPDVNVVYAHNDPMTEAAIISAESADLDLDSMLFIGIDGLPTPDGGIRSVIDGRIDVTYVYPTGGERGDRLRRADPRGGCRAARLGDPRDRAGDGRQRPGAARPLHRRRVRARASRRPRPVRHRPPPDEPRGRAGGARPLRSLGRLPGARRRASPAVASRRMQEDAHEQLPVP